MKSVNFVWIILGTIAAICAACFGQAPIPVGGTVLVDRTAELQALLDGPDATVDLRGELWPVKRVTLHPGNSGKTIVNGTIKYSGPDGNPQYYLVEMYQGRKWNGVTYPTGDVSAKLIDVVLDGSFDALHPLQEHNEFIAAQQGKDFNLIGGPQYGTLTLDNCSLVNCGVSGTGGSCNRLESVSCQAYRVAKHVHACPGWGAMRVKITDLTTIECGNSFDLSNTSKTFYDLLRPDIAEISGVSSFDNRGRTKIASPNWIVRFKNLVFEQSNIVTMNMYPGLDFSYKGHAVQVDGYTARKCIYGIGTLSDSEHQSGTLEIRNAILTDCFYGAKVQQRMTLDGATITGHYKKYVSGTPIERSVVESGARDAVYWAGVFDSINRLYAAKNAEWGTNYKPAISLPKEITGPMETQ